ncbi:MAG TPA: energy transducer TonB [Steroidobacteraceae bacterium]|nr:energy transducer TonB [Steroidobacteraceae bacterium]
MAGRLQPILQRERGDSMRTAVVIAVCVATVAGCASSARPGPPARVALPPFDDAPVSFVVAGPRFTPGEVTIVKVCIAPDRSILSAAVMASSGDRRFDDLAVTWARQVRVRAAPPDGSPVQRCGEVRVEIRIPSEPRVVSGADSALS